MLDDAFDEEEARVVRKEHLPAELRRRAAAMVQALLSDQAVAALIGPEGRMHLHSSDVALPDGQFVRITLEIDVWSEDAA